MKSRLYTPGPPHARVELRPDAVVKYMDANLARTEAQKTQLAADLGESTGLFRAPRVLKTEPGAIRLERLTDLTCIRNVLANPGWEDCVRRAGHALAVIHTHLQMPSGSRIALRPPYAGSPIVGIHGDFNTHNLFVDETGQLVILDWSTAIWTDPGATVGPAVYDLAMFTLAAFYQRPWDAEPVHRSARVARLFLDEYARHRPFSRRDYRRLASRMSRAWARYLASGPWWPGHPLARIPSLIHYHLFLRVFAWRSV